MSNYLREQSAGEILRGTLRIYRQNFLPLCGMYLLLIVPLQVLKLELTRRAKAGNEVGWVAMWLVIGPFAVAALTVAVSDICLGNRPSIARSLRRIFGVTAGKLIGTNLFIYLITALAFIPVLFALHVVENSCPLAASCLVLSAGLVVLFQTWLMFAPTIVVLERSFGWEPLLRSRILGKGFYLRNLGVVVILYIISWSIGLVAFYFQVQEKLVLEVVGAICASLFAPLPLIAIVLLYYDLRVRSEGYDLAALGQDLRR